LESRALLHGAGLEEATAAAAASDPATHFLLLAPENVAVGSAAPLAVVALDAANHPARGYAGTVHFTTTDAATGATVPVDYTFTPRDHGFHLFHLTLETTGPESVTASDTATSSITGGITVTVNPAPVATHLGLFAPRQVVVGQATPVEVVALDAANHIVSNYTGTVDVSPADANATVAPTSYTFTAADHGEHRFMVTLTTAGTEVITATDSATSSITGNVSLSVTPAPAATHLGLLVPEFASAGQPTTVEVVALDASNHPVPGYAGTVQITSGDGGATLPASYNFTADDHGFHAFQVTFATPGSESVTATDTANNLTGIATTTVASAAVATHFEVLAHANNRVGQAVQVLVVALDAANHPVPGYTGTVHFNSGDGAAVLPADYTFVAGDKGFHLFRVTFGTAGSESLTVTDTLNNAIAGMITVNVRNATGGNGFGGFFALLNHSGSSGAGLSNASLTDAVFADVGGGHHRHWWR
jgi:hypothetical protein